MTKEEKEKLFDDLQYFWQYKGDIERFCGYNEEVITKEFPHIMLAWKNYKASIKLLDDVFSI